jgi:putative tricarboxylic transport membrane protein
MTSMISYQNDWTVFFRRPISGVVMVFVAIALVYPLLRHLRQKRDKQQPGGVLGARR